ncbi:M28 family peptidase [candidate division KSB1 bacterium]
MTKHRSFLTYIVSMLILFSAFSAHAQRKGMESITDKELFTHLSFIASDALEGRDTPSRGLKTAAQYLATWAASYGFQPILQNGSFIQEIPLEITSVSQSRSRITLKSGLGDQVFYFPQAFGGRFNSEGSFSGEVIFVGYGVDAVDLGWDDYGDLDYTGKVVVMLDGELPEDHVLRERIPGERRSPVSGRRNAPRMKGATAVLSVISEERERWLADGGFTFDTAERGRFISNQPDSRGSQQTGQGGAPAPFVQAEIRHDVATAILGVSRRELSNMFSMIAMERQVDRRELNSTRVDITIGLDRRMGHTQNVVAYLEGSDSRLKNEYVLFGAHYDHMGAREGRVWNGADDDGSGTVALLEIAQAMTIERPKRSVIIVWHTGEEKGLQGARYFVNNSPVPIESMSAQINIDMIGRNDPNSVFPIGAGRLSTELDAIMKQQNDRNTKLILDYTYDAPDDPNRFYSRSDHYMYAQFGVPIIFFFAGTHDDYHQHTDTIEKIDFNKMRNVTRLAYLIGYEVGNKNELLKLDADPEVITRGKHNVSTGR